MNFKNIVFLYLFFPFFSLAQNASNFKSPLNIKLNLAGIFGEIRGNHFHSGIDIKTNQRQGYPVMAVADGYVSRLRVQESGFGYAVYISHPNGITSVYAHLSKFNSTIARWVKNYQYQNKTYAADFMLTPIEIPLKQGDIIGFSGNSGSSVAPHLHFETRDTKTEEIINPLKFGFKITDNIKPTIGRLYVYQLNNKPFSNYTAKKPFAIKGVNGNYILAKNQIINVSGQIGFGIQTSDKFSGNSNTNGIYSTSLYVDDKLIYETVINQFSFENSRSINSYIDYPLLLNSGITVQKSFAAAGIKPNFYTTLVNNGKLNITDQNQHQLKYIVKDFAGNSSQLNFKIKGVLNASADFKSTPIVGKWFKFDEDNEVIEPDFKLQIPKNILYDDLDFNYHKSPKTKWGYSAVYHIHNKLTPLHSSYNLWIMPDSSLINLNKAVIVNTNGIYQGGELDNSFIKATPKTFGSFYVTFDSLPPQIKPIFKTSNLSLTSKMQFKISDNLSGIKSYNGYIDNQWVLMELEGKTSILTHFFDERTGFGKHTFKLIVIDNKENTKEYSTIFYR